MYYREGIAQPRKFWMVKGFGPTKFHHATLADAEHEAKRLAKENPGQYFYVMEVQSAFVERSVAKIDLSGGGQGAPKDSEIPF